MKWPRKVYPEVTEGLAMTSYGNLVYAKNSWDTTLDQHFQREYVIYGINGAVDSTVSTMPAFIRVSDLRPLLVHGQKITRADLHTRSTNGTNILFDHRWHKLTLLKTDLKSCACCPCVKCD
jgi:hypothetical protein